MLATPATTPAATPESTPSAARVAANRANAQKSTGPRTPEGKARSRANAYRHGMAGAGVVLPPDQAEAVAAAEADLVRDLRPRGRMGLILARQAAAAAVRLDRCRDHDRAATAFRVRHAAEQFLDDRAAAVDLALDRLADDPGGSVRTLLRSPAGVERLIELWEAVAQEILPETLADRAGIFLPAAEAEAAARDQPICDPSRWDARILALAENLQGRRAGDLAPSRFHHLATFARRATGPAILARALEEMAGFINGQIADLIARHDEIDRDALALDVAEAPRRALFAADHASILARRYEAAAERVLGRTLRELRALAADPDPMPPLAPPPPRPVAPPPVASTGEPITPPAAPRRPRDPSPADRRAESLGSFRPTDAANQPAAPFTAARRDPSPPAAP